MSDPEIQLTQIEKTDLLAISSLLKAGFSNLIAENLPNLDVWFERASTANDYSFAIKAKKQGDHRNFLVGICGIRDINWTARHGQFFFMMIDRDGHKATMQNYPATQTAVSKLLAFAFDDLNLNKVWIDVLEKNDIKESLEYMGFVAEGIRRSSIFRDGYFINSVVCSITYDEYCDKVNR